MAFGDFTVVRASSKRVLGSSGTLVTYANNVPAFEWNADGSYRGLSVEPGATNTIRNNTMQGAVVGAPGTKPTNWFESIRGLSSEVVALGTENGVTYIDLKYSGTATSTGNCVVSTESTLSTVATTGQAWAGSAWIKKIAEPAPPTEYRLNITEYTSAGAFVLSNNLAIAPTSTLVRYSYPLTLSGGGTVARVAFGFSFGVTSGASYDFTIRIGLPQMETGSVATSVIPTTSGTANRSADAITLTGASSLIGQTEGALYVDLEILQYSAGISRRILDVYTDVNNRITFTSEATQVLSALVVNGGVVQAQIAMSSSPSGMYKVAIGYAVNDVVFYANGNQIGTDSVATIPATSIVGIGSGSGGTQFGVGWIRSVALFTTRLSNATLASLTS